MARQDPDSPDSPDPEDETGSVSVPSDGEFAAIFEETVSSDADEPRDPSRIGPFQILGVLGKGGMGVVYLAEQLKPVRRRVALKLIKLGMDTREVVARFEAERQALALMNHPSIAKVYDAGATEEGRPYFVMEPSVDGGQKSSESDPVR